MDEAVAALLREVGLNDTGDIGCELIGHDPVHASPVPIASAAATAIGAAAAAAATVWRDASGLRKCPTPRRP